MTDTNKSLQNFTVTELTTLIEQTVNRANTVQTAILKKEITEKVEYIAKDLEESKQKIQLLQNNVLALERKIRKNNIVVFGMTVNDRSKLLDEVLKNLNNILGKDIQRQDINNIYTLKKEDPASPIILEFVSFLRKQEVFKNIQKFKGSGIAISNDACQEDRIKYKVLSHHLKQAREQKLSARIRGFSLEIENKLYTVKDLQELESRVELSDNEEGNSDHNCLRYIPPATSELAPAEGSTGKNLPAKNIQKRSKSKTNYKPKTRSVKFSNK